MINKDPPSSLAVISANAKRLLEDAETLFRAGRNPTTVALAILAIEEAGKYFLTAFESEPSSKNKKRLTKGRQAHLAKQMYFKQIKVAKKMLSAVSSLDDYIKSKNWKSYEEFFQTLNEWQRKSAKIPKMRSMDMESLKQKGLYVDLAATGDVISSPDELTKNEAAVWLGFAREMVSDVLSYESRRMSGN